MNYSVISVLYKLLDLVSWLIFIQCIMSFFPSANFSKFYDLISTITEPIQAPVRRLLSKYTNGPIDFTPLATMLIIGFIKRLLLNFY